MSIFTWMAVVAVSVLHYLQTTAAFQNAMDTLEKAGVVMVEFDVGLMLAEQQRNAPDYNYEMPREIARQGLLLYVISLVQCAALASAVHRSFCLTLSICLINPQESLSCDDTPSNLFKVLVWIASWFLCLSTCSIQDSTDTSEERLYLRYLYQHRYNLTLSALIDQIDSPLVRASMEAWAYRDLDDWPSPQDYLHMLGTGDSRPDT